MPVRIRDGHAAFVTVMPHSFLFRLTLNRPLIVLSGRKNGGDRSGLKSINTNKSGDECDADLGTTPSWNCFRSGLHLLATPSRLKEVQYPKGRPRLREALACSPTLWTCIVRVASVPGLY